MNIFNLFRDRDIKRQVDLFVEYKVSMKGWGTGINHREWLGKFIAVTHCKDVYKVTENDICYFTDWVIDKHPTEYSKLCALNALRCFFRFYKRYDILAFMIKLGRKPNYVMIGKVKMMRAKNPPVPYREIVNKLREEMGTKKIYLGSVARWAKARI
jgi:hypothetical protein